MPYSRALDTQDDPKVPLQKLLETCPLLISKENFVQADLNMLPKTVEVNLYLFFNYNSNRVISSNIAALKTFQVFKLV